MPSMVIGFTPKMRSSSAARSKAGWFPCLRDLRARPGFSSLALGRDGADAGGGRGATGGQCGYVAPQLLVAFLHLLLVKIIGVHRLLQLEQNIFFPVPLQTLHDLLFAGLTAWIAQLGQNLCIPLSLQHGADDRLPTHPANIAQGIMQLHIHLDHGLLHPLDAASGIADVLAAQAPQGAHRVDFRRRQKTGTQ